MKKLFDIWEIGACLVLLLLSEGWQAARRFMRPVGVALERLALVALYIVGDAVETVSGLFADEMEVDCVCCGC